MTTSNAHQHLELPAFPSEGTPLESALHSPRNESDHHPAEELHPFGFASSGTSSLAWSRTSQQPSTRRASLNHSHHHHLPSTRPGSRRCSFKMSRRSSIPFHTPPAKDFCFPTVTSASLHPPLDHHDDAEPFFFASQQVTKEETQQHLTATVKCAAAPIEVKRDWADHCAELWNKKVWFPSFMGTDIPSFARFIFLHSLLLTSITPFVRAVTGVWKAEVPSVWILNTVYQILLAASSSTGSGRSTIASNSSSSVEPKLVEGGSLTYRVDGATFTRDTSPQMDNTWVMHATCGLMWLVVSYIQIAIIPKYGSKSLHRRTGPVALIVLFLHLGAALNTLINDHQKHQTLNKVALSTMTFYVGAYAIVGTQKAFAYLMFRKDGKTSPAEVAALLKEHVNQMMIGWIWSLSGAGPIRMVGAFLEPMGFGPLRCQDEHGSLSPVECMWPYFNRMLWIASWNLLMCGCYCKIMQQHELTKGWIRNMIHHVKLCTFFFVLNMIPGSAEFVSMILGGSANPASSIITYALWVAQAMQFAAFFPSTTSPSS